MCLGSKLTNKVKKMIIYFFQRSGDTKCVLKIAEYTHCTVCDNTDNKSSIEDTIFSAKLRYSHLKNKNPMELRLRYRQ